MARYDREETLLPPDPRGGNRASKVDAKGDTQSDGTPLGPCPLCGREMFAGPSVDRHHWIPKSEGGRDWSWTHTICHRKLHATFDEKTLARDYPDAESLKAHPEIARFIKWVAKKPPRFRSAHRRSRRTR